MVIAFFQDLQCRREDAFQRLEVTTYHTLRRLIDELLGSVDEFHGRDGGREPHLVDVSTCADDTALDRRLLDDLGIILDVLGRRNKLREFGQVGHAANTIEVTAALDVVTQNDDVNRLAGRSEAKDGVTDGDMLIEVEVIRLR